MELVQIYYKNLIITKQKILVQISFHFLLFFELSLLDLDPGGKMTVDPYPKPWLT